MKTRGYEVLFPLLLLAIFIVVFYTSDEKLKKNLERIYSQYPKLERYHELDGYVLELYDPVGYKETPSLSFITFKDVGNYRVHATSYIDFGRVGIDQEVRIGDSLIKKAGSDTIWLKHKYEAYQESHLFLLRN